MSDVYPGLKAAIGAVLLGSSWQRRRVHFMRTVLAVVPKGNADMVAAAICTVIDQPDANHVAEQHVVIVGMLGRRLPEVKALLRLAWAVLID